MSRSTTFLRDLVRAAGWHRKLLAAVCAAAAVYFAITALSPDPPRSVAVLAAGRDLPGGSTPAGADLRTVRLPPDAVPAGAVRPGAALGSRVLAAPVRAGEPLTDARFVAPGLVRHGAVDVVAYPVRIDDADVAALLRVGDRIDLLAASSTDARTARLVASGVPVVALPVPARASPGGTTGALVVVSVTPTTAGQIAQAVANARVTVALTGKSG